MKDAFKSAVVRGMESNEETKDGQVEEMTVLCEQVDVTTTRRVDPVKMVPNASSTDDDNKQPQAEMHTSRSYGCTLKGYSWTR